MSQPLFRPRSSALILALLLAFSPLGKASAVPLEGPRPTTISENQDIPIAADLSKAFQAFRERFQAKPGCRGADISFWVAERGPNLNQSPIFSVGASLNMLPASTLKVVTAASVLEHFSPTDRLATRLLFDGVDQLALVGAGDPELTRAQLATMVQGLKPLPAPIRKLWVDSRLFTQEVYPPGWSWDDLEETYAPEIRSLLIEHGFVTDPSWLSPEAKKASLPEGKQNLRNVDLAAGYALQSLLPDRPEVARASTESWTGWTEVGRVTSRPVYEILRQGLAVSDNLVMECMHRLCREERPKGLTGDIRIVDGSGLSRYNLVTTRTLGETLLSHPGLKDLLPAPGGEGTLRTRFLKLTEKLRAKTGTMSGVSGLAGEFTVNGRDYVFAMLTNGVVGSAKPAKEAEEEWLGLLYEALAQTPRGR